MRGRHPIGAQPRHGPSRLAPLRTAWHGAGMAPKSKSPMAGGFPIALGAIGGTVAGLVAHQPTIGFLAGLALGVIVALLIWWRDR